MATYAKESLTEMLALLEAAKCEKHGSEFLVVCGTCRSVACSKCYPQFCWCENDE